MPIEALNIQEVARALFLLLEGEPLGPERELYLKTYARPLSFSINSSNL